MTDQPLVVVHRFGSEAEAALALSALEAAGIDAMIQADTAGGEYPGVALARGIAIVVRSADQDAARDVLDLPARTEPGS